MKDGWQDKFISELAKHGNVTLAAKAAKVSRTRAYQHQEESQEFADLWADALEQAGDVLEGEAHRRAVSGVLKPIYQGGKKVGAVREYSDGLLTLLLKAAKPEKYRERQDITSNGKELAALVNMPEEKIDERIKSLEERKAKKAVS